MSGPVCGKLDATQTNVTVENNEVTVTFSSGPHRSGRGFLLSYATDEYPGMFVFSLGSVRLVNYFSQVKYYYE